MNQSNSYLTPFLIFLIVIGVSLSVCLYLLQKPVVMQEGGAVYYLRPGISKKILIKDLADQGIDVPYPKLFYYYIYLNKTAYLKTGEYFFSKNATAISIWRQITQGQGHFNHAFTIIPGWTIKQLRETLTGFQDLAHHSTKLNDQALMGRLGFPKLKPEGMFFPDTYYYARDNSDLIILKKAFYLMQKKLHEAWLKRSPNLPYQNAYEALIAASLIEKEAYLNNERPMIASVLINRLKHNMALQFDPTVIYGLGARYTGSIRKEDLLDHNPYNTYVKRGLPPTPIAIPSLDSINAALHPKDTAYYYFVANGDGSHQFSKTLEEHTQAVSRVIKHPVSHYLKQGPKIPLSYKRTLKILSLQTIVKPFAERRGKALIVYILRTS